MALGEKAVVSVLMLDAECVVSRAVDTCCAEELSPVVDVDIPFLLRCHCDWIAFASAFSWVRINWAKFYRLGGKKRK